MSEPPVVTDKAIEAAERAVGASLGRGEPSSVIAARAIEAATPWLAFTAGGLAADLLRDKDERIAELEQQVALSLERLDLKPGDRIIVTVPGLTSYDDPHQVAARVREVFKISPDIALGITDGDVTITTEPDPAAARIAELVAALTDVLNRFTRTDSGRTARVSGTVLARWQAIASGQDGGTHGG